MRTKIFFDTEFTGLHQNTSLISIGCISECEKQFYAEFGDYKQNQVDWWIQENVIDNLTMVKPLNFSKVDGYSIESCNKTRNIYGDRKFITKELESWLSQFDEVEMWSDTLAYDWVLFCELFGGAFSIPTNVYYIPFDIASFFKICGVDPDINREEFANLKKDFVKHNSLSDAQVIKACFERLSDCFTIAFSNHSQFKINRTSSV